MTKQQKDVVDEMRGMLAGAWFILEQNGLGGDWRVKAAALKKKLRKAFAHELDFDPPVTKKELNTK